MDLIVYADFSSPESYLASRRVDVLERSGVAVQWRAVEQHPELPMTGSRLSADQQDALERRWEMLDGLLLPGESLPWMMPRIVPRTEAAVSAFAEAHGSSVEGDVRRLLFDLYWRDGADIGNPGVLRTPLVGPMMRSDLEADPIVRFGYAVTVNGAPITTAAHRRIRGWRAAWHELGCPELPTVRIDAETSTGLDAVRRLGKQISELGAECNAVLGDPRRYPDLAGLPPPAWVSQIGGRWRTAYRLDPAAHVRRGGDGTGTAR